MDPMDAVLSRRFDRSGGGNIDIHVWKPIEVAENTEWACPYQVKGLGDEKMRFCRGVDSVQAFWLTLLTLSSMLYASDAYKADNLTFLGSRDLGLPVQPGEKPGSQEYEKADVLAPTRSPSVVMMPGQRFASVAFRGEELNALIGCLESMGNAVEANPSETANRLASVVRTLQEGRDYYEAICAASGIKLSYLKTER